MRYYALYYGNNENDLKNTPKANINFIIDQFENLLNYYKKFKNSYITPHIKIEPPIEPNFIITLFNLETEIELIICNNNINNNPYIKLHFIFNKNELENDEWKNYIKIKAYTNIEYATNYINGIFN